MSKMADNLPFRADAEAAKSGPGPVGALLPWRERGQEAPSGASLGDSLGTPDALGTGSNTFPAKLSR